MKKAVVILAVLSVSCVPRDWSKAQQEELILACFDSEGTRTECGKDQVARPVVWEQAPGLRVWASDFFANDTMRVVAEWNELLGFEMLVYDPVLSDDIDVYVFDMRHMADSVWYSGINGFMVHRYFEGELTASVVMLAPEHGTMMHEFGHVLGLTHDPDNPYSIMYPVSTGRKVTATIEPIDLQILQRKYKPVVNCIADPENKQCTLGRVR